MRKGIRTDIHVRIEPRRKGDFGIATTTLFGQHAEAEAIAECEEIASQIRRHVDGLSSDRSRGVHVSWTNENVCSHCGADWTEDASDYNGGCCTKDIENEPKEVSAA